MRVCVCECVYACVRVCVRACVRACARARVCIYTPKLYLKTGTRERLVPHPVVKEREKADVSRHYGQPGSNGVCSQAPVSTPKKRKPIERENEIAVLLSLALQIVSSLLKTCN